MHSASYLELYLLMGCFVGIGNTLYEVFTELPGFLDRNNVHKLLEPYVAGGDVQKEIYGKRTVYYRNNDRGEAAISIVNVIARSKIRAAIYIIISLVFNFVLWPFIAMCWFLVAVLWSIEKFSALKQEYKDL